MLQSAIYAEHQSIDLVSPFAFVRHLRGQAQRAGRFASLVAWSRELLPDGIGGLNSHLLRDIGLDRSFAD